MPLQSFTIRDKENRKQKIIVIFEDEQLLVVNKPANLLVIPDRWNKSLPNLYNILESKFIKNTTTQKQSIWIVHRIDADTSGLVLFAKTAEMHQRLNQLFEAREIEKTYLAIVSGNPPHTEGTMDLPISQHQTRKKFMRIDEKGKPSLTKYKVIEQFKHYSLLEVYPKTGRTHQIRVHLSSINCPLAVDPLYGNSHRITIFDIKSNYRSKTSKFHIPSLIDRLTLHAYQIKFSDPLSNKEYSFEAEIPKDFQAVLKVLHKYDK